jgi:hypothetical protein
MNTDVNGPMSDMRFDKLASQLFSLTTICTEARSQQHLTKAIPNRQEGLDLQLELSGMPSMFHSTLGEMPNRKKPAKLQRREKFVTLRFVNWFSMKIKNSGKECLTSPNFANTVKPVKQPYPRDNVVNGRSQVEFIPLVHKFALKDDQLERVIHFGKRNSDTKASDLTC